MLKRKPTTLEKLIAWGVIAGILSSFLGCANNRQHLGISASLAAVHSDGPDHYTAKVEIAN